MQLILSVMSLNCLHACHMTLVSSPGGLVVMQYVHMETIRIIRLRDTSHMVGKVSVSHAQLSKLL